MHNSLKKIVSLLDKVSLYISWVLSIAVLIIILIILIEVVARYFFNNPTVWAMESATMIFGIYMMGGGIYSLLINGHVRMDVVYSKLSKRLQATIDCITFPLLLSFLAIIFWKASVYAGKSIAILEHSSTAWSPPIYIWKATVPVIVGLFMLQSLANFIRNIFLAVSGKEL